MKKTFALIIMLSFSLSACIPAVFQSQPASPTPISEEALQATAALLSQQTLQALPTPTSAPSSTPVVTTPTNTPTQATPTETQNPILLTLTATLGTGTVTPGNETAGTQSITSNGTLQSTASSLTPNPFATATTPQPQFFGTLPPDLPYGSIVLTNKSEVEVYISLRCETSKGNVTILEYPVKKYVDAEAPIGQYTYVAWVGGREFTGAFSLSDTHIVKIDFFKNRITIK
ncbi:MAG: hypothetical protein U0V02_08760 [Anaerolineales bacterium]